jgi:hypothetical protein
LMNGRYQTVSQSHLIRRSHLSQLRERSREHLHPTRHLRCIPVSVNSFLLCITIVFSSTFLSDDS